MLISISRNQHR